MTTIACGTDLPASTHRNPNTLYVSDRSIDNLQVLDVEGDVLFTAKLGDELLDPSGSSGDAPLVDGKLTVFELDRLDEPNNKATLFPKEAAAVAKVHKLFEIPESTPVTLPPVNNLQYVLERRVVSPAVTSIQIDDLDPALQQSARRLQLAKNGDSNPTTIQRDDILWAKQPANSTRFTASVVADFDTIAALFSNSIIEEKVVGILPPIQQRQRLMDAGPAKIDIESRVGFLTYGSIPKNSPPYYLFPKLYQRQLVVEAPDGYQVFLKNTARLGTHVDFFEKVMDGNGQPETFEADFINKPGSSLWVEVLDPTGNLVHNSRVDVPVTELGPFLVSDSLTSRQPAVRNRKIDEWRDIDGNVVDHKANGDQGIPGYILDCNSHLFALELINTH